MVARRESMRRQTVSSYGVSEDRIRTPSSRRPSFHSENCHPARRPPSAVHTTQCPYQFLASPLQSRLSFTVSTLSRGGRLSKARLATFNEIVPLSKASGRQFLPSESGCSCQNSSRICTFGTLLKQAVLIRSELSKQLHGRCSAISPERSIEFMHQESTGLS